MSYDDALVENAVVEQAKCPITILDERQGIWGRLDGITESGEVIIADIGKVRVELPIPSAILEPLVGQDVIIGLFDGSYRVGRCRREL